jgi:pimeloyl-ACP methyl ester carboxylesterase
MNSQPSSHQLDVPGGSVYYEVRGSGPLLLVVGQPMTSAALGPLADSLAEDYTVVTYDPHGLGESTVDDPSLPVTPEIEAEDLAHIVDALGGGKADVFGTSGAAVTGLALVTRYPEKVGTLIAHEPPLPEMLPDAPHVRTVVDEVEDAYNAYGTGPAWGKFAALVMHSGPVSEDGVPPVAWPPPGADGDGAADEEHAADGEAAESAGEMPEPSEKQQADDELFFFRMLKPFTRYQPAVDVLRTAGPRVVVAVGATSREEIPARSSRALAEQLGISATVFPGHHAGFMADPAGFAAAIRQVLAITP